MNIAKLMFFYDSFHWIFTIQIIGKKKLYKIIQSFPFYIQKTVQKEPQSNPVMPKIMHIYMPWELLLNIIPCATAFLPSACSHMVWMPQTTLKADCNVEENWEAMVWVANCWNCFLASESSTRVAKIWVNIERLNNDCE